MQHLVHRYMYYWLSQCLQPLSILTCWMQIIAQYKLQCNIVYYSICQCHNVCCVVQDGSRGDSMWSRPFSYLWLQGQHTNDIHNYYCYTSLALVVVVHCIMVVTAFLLFSFTEWPMVSGYHCHWDRRGRTSWVPKQSTHCTLSPSPYPLSLSLSLSPSSLQHASHESTVPHPSQSSSPSQSTQEMVSQHILCTARKPAVLLFIIVSVCVHVCMCVCAKWVSTDVCSQLLRVVLSRRNG